VKKPPGVLLLFVAPRCEVSGGDPKAHDFPECDHSAAHLSAKQEAGGVGCVFVDPSVLAGASAET
jgi:hypothetical protein